VTDVIDTGQHKVLRYDPSRGLDRLELERIPADSAEQRAGRAGRTGPGRVLRLWDERDILRPRREPEIERVDLASPVLDVLAWGGDPRSFEWFEAPPADALAAAVTLLERLDACQEGHLTPDGAAMHRLPVHPRLARVLLSAAACGRGGVRGLAEGWRPQARGDTPTTDSDVLSAADRMREAPHGVRAAARELEALVPAVAGSDAGDERLLRALVAGFPDRVARRREPGSPRLVLSSGTGALLARESGVREGELVLALDVTGGVAGAAAEPLCWVASRAERQWLSGVRTGSCTADEASGWCRGAARRPPCSPAAIPPDRRRAGLLRGRGAPGWEAGSSAGVVRRRLGCLQAAVSARPHCAPLADAAVALDAPLRPARRLAPSAGAAEQAPPRRYREDGSCSRPQAAGLFGLNASHRSRREPGVRLLAPRPARADDARPTQLLGAHLRGGSQGASGPLSEAPVARRSLERRTHASRKKASPLMRARTGCVPNERSHPGRSVRIAQAHGNEPDAAERPL
jgi:hypothetical protein